MAGAPHLAEHFASFQLWHTTQSQHDMDAAAQGVADQQVAGVAAGGADSAKVENAGAHPNALHILQCTAQGFTAGLWATDWTVLPALYPARKACLPLTIEISGLLKDLPEVCSWFTPMRSSSAGQTWCVTGNAGWYQSLLACSASLHASSLLQCAHAGRPHTCLLAQRLGALPSLLVSGGPLLVQRNILDHLHWNGWAVLWADNCRSPVQPQAFLLVAWQPVLWSPQAPAWVHNDPRKQLMCSWASIVLQPSQKQAGTQGKVSTRIVIAFEWGV